MKVLFSDGYVLAGYEDVFPTFKYKILTISVSCGEDRPDIIGICRITSVNIELDEKNVLDNEVVDTCSFDENIVQDAETKLYNYVLKYEYNKNNDNWAQEVIEDIARVTGSSDSIIHLA